MDKGYTKIFLKDVRMRMRIGILPAEKAEAQDVIVNVELFTVRKNYLSTRMEDMIDYRGIYEFVTGLKDRPHTELIETLVQDLIAACFSYADVAACKVSVSKPHIFEHAAGVGVEAFMTRTEFEKIKRRQQP